MALVSNLSFGQSWKNNFIFAKSHQQRSFIKIYYLFIPHFLEKYSKKNRFRQSIKNHTKCHNTPRDNKFEREIQSFYIFFGLLFQYYKNFFFTQISRALEKRLSGNVNEKEKKSSR